jgi:hypothetical protein
VAELESLSIAQEIVFVDFANAICEFWGFWGDFLGRGGNTVILSHKHYVAIPSQ